MLAGFVFLTFLAPLAGAWAPPGEWYRSLNKPSWTPPSWLFGPAWTFLYLSMAVAAWVVWRRAGWSAPLRWWLAQLALNAVWTPLFFGLRQPGWAFAEIVLLWLAIAVTMVKFFRVKRWAGALLVPYLLWVTFAATLNFALWRMNAAQP
ncbi:MAG: tryptophan-rich sensory protein [Verrucomicrobiae bacterium]|nr:tryptophan-rich sensory protein [Verrucomicrobiae bacterium]